MAINLDEDASPRQHVTVASQTIGSGDFAFSMYLRVADLLTGTLFKYFLSNRGVGDAESVNCYFDEDTSVLTFRGLGRSGISGAGDFRIDSSGEPGTVANWQHYLFQRNGSTYEMYVNGSSEGTDTVTDVSAFDIVSTWYIGARQDLNTSRFFNGDIAEFAFWDGRSFSAAEAASMAAGFTPLFFRESLTIYVPFIRQYQDYAQGLTVTNNNTTVSDHPTGMIYPVPNIGRWATAAAPATGQPTMRRWGGIPGMSHAGVSTWG